jgi:carbon storage regulator
MSTIGIGIALRVGVNNHRLWSNVMLVISRKVGESVIIDGGITVTITSIDGNKIRLGISAPRDVRVDREETHRARSEFAVTGYRIEEPLVGS